MPTTKCKFCNDLQEWFEIDRDSLAKYEYFTTLVRCNANKQKGRITSNIFPLIYCPVCGVKIKKEGD